MSFFAPLLAVAALTLTTMGVRIGIAGTCWPRRYWSPPVIAFFSA